MKSLVISFSFLVLFISSLNSEPVLDTDGNEVKAGESYYIVSAIWGAGGGGVSVTTTGNQNCPISVAQEGRDTNYGQSVMFSPTHSNPVELSRSLNIKFTDPISCASSGVWQVGSYSEDIKSEVIEINGVEGKPSCETFRNWFKIEKGEKWGYKLVADASEVCDIPIAKYDVGKFSTEGKIVLGLTTEQAFLVVFIKQSVGRIELPTDIHCCKPGQCKRSCICC